MERSISEARRDALAETFDRRLFETKNYELRIALVPQEGMPAFMAPKYIVYHKKHGVVYSAGGSLGHGIAGCLQAEAELTKALELADEEAAKNSALPTFS